jgi:hypothetical protein
MPVRKDVNVGNCIVGSALIYNVAGLPHVVLKVSAV